MIFIEDVDGVYVQIVSFESEPLFVICVYLWLAERESVIMASRCGYPALRNDICHKLC